jgi:prepilin-type N-terminal cleavage/methylation domain-containing protein
VTHISARRQKGFSLIECMVAVVVLMVGALGVAQMIPYSLGTNTSNRADSTGLIIAQRELEQFLQQPLTSTSYTDATANPCNPCGLGSSATFSAFVGSPTIVVNKRTMIDFSQAKAANYNFTYTDPQDPTKTRYDVRWAVVTTGTPGNIMSRRFVMSVRKNGPGPYILPATLDVLVSK